MTGSELSTTYRGYIACLNSQDWPNLGAFVDDDVHYNGERIKLSGYRAMLEADFRAIPDLVFEVRILLADPPRIASRLEFDCTPTGLLFGLLVNGKRVRFAENIIYTFQGRKIAAAWSIIDKAAIRAQL